MNLDGAAAVSIPFSMILAAHQPLFIPWLGYFDKIARADCFVAVDHVQFTRQNYQNRNRVKLVDGVHWVTVPVERGCRDDRLCDKRLLHAGGVHGDWGRRILRTLDLAYRRAPHYGRYAPALRAVLARRFDRLVDLNLQLLELCLDWLAIRTLVVRSSSLSVTGAKTELIAALCQKTGADHYLSGSGGSRAYLDVAALEARNIRVTWQSFHHPVYPQLYAGPFQPQLSVLDLLFNCGPASGSLLRKEVAATAANRLPTPLAQPI